MSGTPRTGANHPAEGPMQIFVDEFLRDWREYERRCSEIACILFADLVGSTEFKRDHSPIEGLAKIVSHNRAVSTAIREFHGVVVKYLGDGVMGVFRGPECQQLAIKAGLAAIQRVDEENGRRGWVYPYAMSTKVGVHFGEVWNFRFRESRVADPQGATVDIAAQLCAMAGAQQLVCTDETYNVAGGGAAFPNASEAGEYFIRGLLEPLTLRAVAPRGREVEMLPRRSVPDSVPDGIRLILDEARSLLRERRHEEALNRYRKVVESFPGCFEANLRIGEIIIHIGNHGTKREQLEDAISHLSRANRIRPESPRVWLLLAWAYLKSFELEDGKVTSLEAAVRSAEKALDAAAEQLDLNGAVQAKTLLARLLLARAHTDTCDAAGDLARANQLCNELANEFGGVLERNRSDYLVTHALVRLAQGDTDYDGIEQMIRESGEIARKPTADEYEAMAAVARTREGQLKRSTPFLAAPVGRRTRTPTHDTSDQAQGTHAKREGGVRPERRTKPEGRIEHEVVVNDEEESEGAALWIPIQIYIADPEVPPTLIEGIERAVRDVLVILGADRIDSGPPAEGSWRKRLVGVFTRDKNVTEKLEHVAELLEGRYLEAPAMKDLAEAIGVLMDKVSQVDNAAITLGTVILMKRTEFDGATRIDVAPLGRELKKVLEANPTVMHSPESFALALSTVQDAEMERRQTMLVPRSRQGATPHCSAGESATQQDARRED